MLKKAVSRLSTEQISLQQPLTAKPRPLTSEDATDRSSLHAFATHFLPSRHQEHHGNSNSDREYTIRANVESQWTECSKHVGHAIQVDCAKEYRPQLSVLNSPYSAQLKTRTQQDA